LWFKRRRVGAESLSVAAVDALVDMTGKTAKSCGLEHFISVIIKKRKWQMADGKNGWN
jgi:hypothetical protein